MQKKKLWKIEELWGQDIHSQNTIIPDISIHSGRQGFSKCMDLILNLESYDIDGISKYYSKFHLVNSFEYQTSKNIVFTDDYGEYRGLGKQQLCIAEKPIYLFDNHNEIIYPFVELYEAWGKQSFSVVHIDAHPDAAEFQGIKPTSIALDEVKDFISQTRISDFFDALSETKIIKDIYRITHSNDFEFFVGPEEPYVLSLDIDIFGPEGDFVDVKDKVLAIKKALGGAMAVCIATSPGFIDQEYAQNIITILSR